MPANKLDYKPDEEKLRYQSTRYSQLSTFGLTFPIWPNLPDMRETRDVRGKSFESGVWSLELEEGKRKTDMKQMSHGEAVDDALASNG